VVAGDGLAFCGYGRQNDGLLTITTGYGSYLLTDHRLTLSEYLLYNSGQGHGLVPVRWGNGKGLPLLIENQ
jgi:hypothetical protein